MSTYDFRILLETKEKKQSSYISSSFVDTDTHLVLSSSQVYNRITGVSGSENSWASMSLGMISCSYVNGRIFTGTTLPESSGSRYFRTNTILSASLTDRILQEKGIEATLKLAESPNSKVIVVGSGENGLPIILGNN